MTISSFFEVTVQIWQDEDEGPVYYSIIQDFDEEDDTDVEPLAYGQVEDFDQAARIVGAELKGLF